MWKPQTMLQLVVMACPSSSFPGTIYVYAYTNSCYDTRYFKCQKNSCYFEQEKLVTLSYASWFKKRLQISQNCSNISHRKQYIEEELLLCLLI